MRQIIKSFLWFGLLALGLQGARAFSLLGPDAQYPGIPAGFGDRWQVTEIGYNPLNNGGAPPYFIDGLQVGPKNLGEEYRRNIPVMYYACNANFLDYFGSNGVAAVDGAFAILNNVFTNNPTGMANGVDGYTASLSEVPLQSLSLNYLAYRLGLLDLKSDTLALMMEQLGLADAVRYTWVIHDRYQPAGTTCPNSTEYTVTMRNFDIVASPLNQLQYSSYINGTLYTYYVTADLCDVFPSPPTVDAFETSVDPVAAFYNAPVASGLGEDGLVTGYYYTGLTRDDVAGLRYLLSSNNINFEAPAPGSVLTGSTTIGVTNLGPPFLLYTSNYNAFWLSARINDPVTLATLFPGLVIVNSSYYFTNLATPIVVAYYTNLSGAPYGAPTLVVKTNGYTYSLSAIYSYTFPPGNLVILPNGFPNTSVSLVTVTVGAPVIGAPYGTLGTNTTTKTVILNNVPSGEYYINTNYLCGPLFFLSTLATNVTATTNFLFAASNSAGYFTSQSLVTYSTTHVYVVQSPICSTTVTGGATNGPGLHPGIQKIQFVRANFDSLLGQFFQPITNDYSMVSIANFHATSQSFRRVVTTPDILLDAADLAPGPAAGSAILPVEFSRNINFGMGNIYPGLAGPGTINPSSTITYNKSGPVFVNQSRYFLNGPNYGGSFIWGSFDGTTNDPVVYPNGTSIQNLENQVTNP